MILFFLFIWKCSSLNREESLDKLTLTLSSESEYTLTEDDVHNSGVYTAYTKIIVKDKITELGPYCFRGCKSLQNIELPETLRKMGTGALYNCVSLKEVIVPNGVQIIEDECFMMSTLLETITFPSTLNSINTKTIVYGSHNLKKFVINENPNYQTASDGKIIVSGTIAIICSSNPIIEIPDFVTELNATFANGCGVQEIIFGSDSKLTTIGNQAFRHSTLVKLGIPPKLQNLHYMIFEGCSLNEFTFPSTLQYVNPDALSSSSVSTLHVADELFSKNVLARENEAIFDPSKKNLIFLDTSAQTFNIPSTLETLPTTSIQNCKSLTTATGESGIFVARNNLILRKVQSIEVLYTVPGGLIDIVIPSTVKELYSKCLSGSNQVQHVTFEANSQCTIFHTAAFQLCRSLKTIELPSSLITVADWAFSSTGFEGAKIVFPASVTRIGTYCFDSSFVSEVDLQNTKITTLADGVFRQSYYLQKISLPQTITSIGLNAFIDAAMLQSFPLLSNVQTIGTDAFSGCKSLSQIQFGEALTVINDRAFNNCNLQEIDIPNSVTELKQLSFANNKNLRRLSFKDDSKLQIFESNVIENDNLVEEIKLGKDVHTVRARAFVYALGLMNIFVSSSNTNYKDVNGVLHTYDGTTLVACPCGRTSISIVNSVQSFGDSAFYSSLLVSIGFNTDSALQSIGFSAFYGCTYLKKIEIPASVVDIADSAFNGCTNLSDVSFAKGSKLSTLGSGSFSGCSLLQSVVFDKDCELTTINPNVFSGCTLLASFDFPPKLTTIGSSAFAKCGLNKVYIGEKVSVIGDSAFNGCPQLKEVWINSNLTQIGSSSFGDCPALQQITYCGSTICLESAFDNPSLKALVSIVYKGDNFGGLTVSHIYDADCKLGSAAFTINENNRLACIVELLPAVIACSSEGE